MVMKVPVWPFLLFFRVLLEVRFALQQFVYLPLWNEPSHSFEKHSGVLWSKVVDYDAFFSEVLHRSKKYSGGDYNFNILYTLKYQRQEHLEIIPVTAYEIFCIVNHK